MKDRVNQNTGLGRQVRRQNVNRILATTTIQQCRNSSSAYGRCQRREVHIHHKNHHQSYSWSYPSHASFIFHYNRSRPPFTAHMNEANVSTSFTANSPQCRATIVASTLWISPTSANTGGCPTPARNSSSSNRELRRRLASFESRARRGRLAGVVLVAKGLAARDVIRTGSSRADGGGGSSAHSGDG